MPAIIKVLVLVCTALVISFAIYGHSTNPSGDSAGNVMFYLGAIGFPTSLLPTLGVLSTVGTVFPAASDSYVFFGICISYFAAILIQWFLLVPLCRRWLSERRYNKKGFGAALSVSIKKEIDS